MTDHLTVPLDRDPAHRGVAGRTLVGFHPRDGRPVACWVVHPLVAEPGALAQLERFTAALGLAEPGTDELVEVQPYRATVTAAAGWATLWVEDETEVVARHDEDWLAALIARGWAVVVIGAAPELADADNAAVEAYLSSGRCARIGIVRVP